MHNCEECGGAIVAVRVVRIPEIMSWGTAPPTAERVTLVQAISQFQGHLHKPGRGVRRSKCLACNGSFRRNGMPETYVVIIDPDMVARSDAGSPLQGYGVGGVCESCSHWDDDTITQIVMGDGEVIRPAQGGRP